MGCSLITVSLYFLHRILLGFLSFQHQNKGMIRSWEMAQKIMYWMVKKEEISLCKDQLLVESYIQMSCTMITSVLGIQEHLV